MARRLASPPAREFLRTGILLLAFAAALAVSPSFAAADADPNTVPVIGPDRGADVLRLLLPYAMDGEVVPGWQLVGVGIGRRSIGLTLRGPGGEEAGIRLSHPEPAEAVASRTASFAVTPEGSDSGETARAALLAALRANDDGAFWRREALPPTPLEGWVEQAHGSGGIVAWLFDGLVLAVLGCVLLLVLLTRKLRGAPRWALAAVAGAVVVGAVLRLTLSVEMPATA